MNVSFFGGGHSSIHNRPKDTILALGKLAIYGIRKRYKQTIHNERKTRVIGKYVLSSPFFKGPNEGKQKSVLEGKRVTFSVWSRD